MKKWSTWLALIVVLFVGFLGGVVGDRIVFKSKEGEGSNREIFREILKEENAVIDVVEFVGPSVVTVGVKKNQRVINPNSFFDSFGFFGSKVQPNIEERQIKRDIGSGFILSKDGLVITNKHVVSDLEVEYRVITNLNEELKVEKIYRDPVNDLAILKVNPTKEFKPIKLGDSDNLKVGQIVIAIGTALGEFRSTVTTGVISGLGRGINAGTPFSNTSEELSNVIQTDAAINPGNSGGPLLNSSGQVIGVNVAVSQAGENIGFAIPINIIKISIDNFKSTGKFSRPYLGVRYQMLDKKTAILNSIPQGAYIVEVVLGSPAEKSGLKENDIVTKIGEVLLTEKNDLSLVISKKRAGDEVKLGVYRGTETIQFKVKLEEVGE
ncbi:MAG: trypsin-like peptidase domain-containing protein [Patescibacteria group bacterium]|nr:trypsin-like peptidase domain-containing protein [Patescibacteria group bacterium]